MPEFLVVGGAYRSFATAGIKRASWKSDILHVQAPFYLRARVNFQMHLEPYFIVPFM